MIPRADLPDWLPPTSRQRQESQPGSEPASCSRSARDYQGQLSEKIENNGGKKQAVDAIEQAAMTGHELTAILHLSLALHERLRQVAQGSSQRESQAEDQSQVPGDLEQRVSQEQAEDQRAEQAAEDPSQVLPGLIWGASLWRPRKWPVKKAAESNVQTAAKSKSSHQRPRGGGQPN